MTRLHVYFSTRFKIVVSNIDPEKHFGLEIFHLSKRHNSSSEHVPPQSYKYVGAIRQIEFSRVYSSDDTRPL